MSHPASEATAAPRRTLVTSALPYANGPIHLGHLAGAYLPADLYVRFLRLRGEDVVYVSGSDEMGVAILMRAHAEGRTPQSVIDTFHPVIEGGLRAAGISFDHYGRTSSDIHRETATAFFEVMAAKGVFSTRTETQLFDPVAGVFLADRFVRGTCPVCGNPDAYGDQCERCGSTLSPSELIDPRSALSDATPEPRETTHWYLPLESTQPALDAWLTGTRDGLDRMAAWKPNVTGQIGSWLAAGLRDRAITRDIAWGVPVPPAVAEAAGVEASGKVLYVWFDAPIGYVSATKEWAALHGRDWRDYWQADRGRDGAAARPLHRQGQHRLPRPHLSGDADAARAGAGRPRAVRAAGAAARERVPEPGGAEVLDEPRLGDLARRDRRTRRYRRACATALRRCCRRRRTPISA